MIVTIDGPAGSGKSTVAAKLANKLAFIHLNSGALFRAVGLKARDLGISPDNDDAVTELAKRTRFAFRLAEEDTGLSAPAALKENDGEGKSIRRTELIVNDKAAGAELFTAEAGLLASRVALLPKLREVLVEVQRAAAISHSVVLEGRDAGTVVFPDADIKFYLFAETDIRARRRFAELCRSGTSKTFEEVKADLEERDLRDRTRSVAPEKKADDAILIDTSSLTVDEVVEELSARVKQRRAE